MLNGCKRAYAITVSAIKLVTFEEALDYAKANCQRQNPTANDGFTNDMLP